MPRKNAAAANCGFVLHLFVLILGGLYLFWIGHPNELIDYFDRTTFHQQGIALLVVVFFGAIFVYFALNAMSVPSIHSRDGICDDYSRPSPGRLPQQNSKSLPPIYDIDVAVINDMVWAMRNEHTQ